MTWHLKRGVVWHDGQPFTADDVVFNWEDGTDPGMTTRHQSVERVERLHDHVYTIGGSSPDPGWLLERYTSWRIPTKANGWIGGDSSHWRSDEYDRLWRAARTELDPARRATLCIRMNDLLVHDVVFIPVLERLNAIAVSNRLRVVPARWDSSLAHLAFWSTASRPGP